MNIHGAHVNLLNYLSVFIHAVSLQQSVSYMFFLYVFPIISFVDDGMEYLGGGQWGTAILAPTGPTKTLKLTANQITNHTTPTAPGLTSGP
jgi:hypothetical protein